jgi:hypothetical protein
MKRSAVGDGVGIFLSKLGALLVAALFLSLLAACGPVTSSPNATPSAEIGSDGGVLTSSTGYRLSIPTGGFSSPTQVKLSAMSEADFYSALAEPFDSNGFIFVGAMTLDVDKDEFELPDKLSTPTLSSQQMKDQAIVVQLLPDPEVIGKYEMVLQEIALLRDNRYETASPPFPGIRSKGIYAVLAPTTPMTFVTGTVVNNTDVPRGRGQGSHSRDAIVILADGPERPVCTGNARRPEVTPGGGDQRGGRAVWNR